MTIEVARLLEVWVLERLHPYRWSTMKPLLAGLIGLGMGITLQRLMPLGGAVPLTVLQGVVVLGTYLVALVMLGLAPEDRLVLERMRHRIGMRR